jgi:hypothetical protein
VGAVGALTILAIRPTGTGVDAGDLVGFLGAVVGTSLAIAGAVWIEDRKRRLELIEAAAPVLEALLILERKSRSFFGHPGERRDHVEEIKNAQDWLARLLPLSPPRNGRLIGLFDLLREGAALLTGELYLMMDEQAEGDQGKRRRVEALLENFDSPLKVLIVEYSRIVDPRSPRAVMHLGKMPDP